MNNHDIALTIFKHNLNYTNKCLFCSPVIGSVLFETPNFRVFLDTFPLCPGHVMISSKEHYGSAGEIPEELFHELNTLKTQIDIWAKSKTSFSIFYEHGRAGSCSSLNAENPKCHHFHLHCLPIKVCIHQELASKKYEYIPMNSYDQIQNLFFQYGNYLFFQNNNGDMFFYVAGEKAVAPHLLRTLVGKSIGKLHLADWEQYNRPDLYIENYEFTKDLR